MDKHNAQIKNIKQSLLRFYAKFDRISVALLKLVSAFNIGGKFALAVLGNTEGLLAKEALWNPGTSRNHGVSVFLGCIEPFFYFMAKKFTGRLAMQKKVSVCVCVGTEQIEKIDADPLTRDLGRSGIFRLMINEYFRRRDGEKRTDGKDRAEHR